MGKPTFDPLYCDGIERAILWCGCITEGQMKVLNSEFIGV